MPKFTTTTQGSDIKVWLPDKAALTTAMLFNTPEAAVYLRQKYEDQLKLAKVDIKSPEVQGVLKVLDEFKENMAAQYDRSDDEAWAGKRVLSDFENLQENLAKKATAEISAKVISGTIQMDYAVNDLAELVRAYQVNDKPIASNLVDSFDKLFNAWLARPRVDKDGNEYALVSQEGSLYKATREGKIQHDQQGNLVKADPEEVRKLIEDEDEGFQRFVKEQSEELQVTTHKREYPEAEGEVTKAEVVRAETKAVQDLEKVEEVEVEEVEVEEAAEIETKKEAAAEEGLEKVVKEAEEKEGPRR